MKKFIIFILWVIFIFAMSLSFIAVRADYQSSNNSRFGVSPQKLADIQAVLNGDMFSVAPYVDSVEPMQMQYDVIEYVLSGRISDIKYFQCGWYHDFGIPVCNIENVYFSM